MRWTERQLALLAGIGLKVWQPGAAAGSGPGAGEAPASADGTAAPPAGRASGSTAAPAARADAEGPAAAPAAVRIAAAPAAARAADAFGGTAAAAATPAEWDALRQAIADCRAGGLLDARRQAVFGDGLPQAHWMVVAEPPGDDEDEAGEPFADAAGQLLDRMLGALGLSRAPDGAPERSVYVVHALSGRTPRDRDPAPDERARCDALLARQVELLRPRVILALGRRPVQALLDSDEPIGRLRGRVHDRRGVPVVVSFDPAYLLRHGAEKARAWEDLCLAAEAVAAAAAGGRSTAGGVAGRPRPPQR